MKKYSLIIGVFDGIHLGHLKLLESVCNKKKIVITFVFDKKGDLLYPINERIKFLKNLGVDKVITVKLDKKIEQMGVKDFLKYYIKKYGIVELFIGDDFKAGKNRCEDAHSIRRSLDIPVNIIPVLKYGNLKIGSSDIKHCIKKGDFSGASKLLVKPYFISCINCFFLIKYISKRSNILYPDDGFYKTWFYWGKTFRTIKNIEIKEDKIILYKFLGLNPKKIEFILKI